MNIKAAVKATLVVICGFLLWIFLRVIDTKVIIGIVLIISFILIWYMLYKTFSIGGKL